MALGLVAGITPGPLLVLIMSETLKFGEKAGIQIAFVPLFSDLPVIIISLLILARLSDYDSILGFISIAGAIYLFILAAENILKNTSRFVFSESHNQSILKGTVANYLSPHPYIFWIVVGGPIFIQAWSKNHLNGIAFLVSFYSFIVGSKVVFTLIFARGITLIKKKSYSLILKVTSILLVALGVWLIYEAGRYLR